MHTEEPWIALADPRLFAPTGSGAVAPKFIRDSDAIKTVPEEVFAIRACPPQTRVSLIMGKAGRKNVVVEQVHLPQPLALALAVLRRSLWLSRSVGLPRAARSASVSTTIVCSLQCAPHWQAKVVAKAAHSQPGTRHGPSTPACKWSAASCLHLHFSVKLPCLCM